MKIITKDGQEVFQARRLGHRGGGEEGQHLAVQHHRNRKERPRAVAHLAGAQPARGGRGKIRGDTMNKPINLYDVLLSEYVATNGRHFNESLAKAVVEGMWHKDANGEIVRGELVDLRPAASVMLDGMPSEEKEKCEWDAYVGANAFLHDLADSGLNDNRIADTARSFWFHDDDLDTEGSKVFWYFFK